MNLTVGLDMKSYKEALGAVAPDVYRKAERSALKKVGDQGKTAASKEIRATFRLKARDVDSKIKVTARAGVPYVDLTASANTLNLIYFNPKQYRVIAGATRVIGNKSSRTLKRRGKDAGVYVQIKGGKTVYLPHAWIMPGKGGVLLVMKRTGKGKSGYQKAALVTVSTLFAGNKPFAAVQRVVADKFGALLAQEYQFYLSRQG